MTIPEVTVARLVAEQTTQQVKRTGPWSFTFTVPIIAGRVAEVNQTVTANDIPVRLERVVVTPSLTRVYLRFPATQGLLARAWNPIVRVAGNGWGSDQGPQGAQGHWLLNDGTYAVHFRSAFYDRRGEWTVTVREPVGFRPERGIAEPGAEQIRLAGPWIFKFMLP